MKFLKEIGSYIFLLRQVLVKPDKLKMFRRQLMTEIQQLGVSSLGIVALISVFIGAIAAILTAYNIGSPLIPASMIGFATRQLIVLEFSPTIISLILAGKAGSRIASEIGTMRVTEQIDALEIMGINPANFLILPKVTACILFFPVLMILSIGFGLFGAYLVAMTTNLLTVPDYIAGLRLDFDGFTVTYALIKTVVFAFLISTISGFRGYEISGGAQEVGRASTSAVVHSSILIILFDLILTQMFLV